MPATLFVVATPIGNLEDMTFRAVRVLGQVALIAAEDTRRTARLLQHYGIRTPRTSFHEHNECQKLRRLMAELHAGRELALVSDAGIPGISDPGYRLVRAAIEAGVRVEVLPGPSAVLTALVLSGFPADRFVFLGFPPVRAAARQAWLTALVPEVRPVVFFEAPHRLRQTLSAALAVLGDRPVAVARELTKLHEEVIRGPLSLVLGRLPEPRGEFTVVLGPPAGPPASAGGPPTDERLHEEFGQMTALEGVTRRAAIARLAAAHSLSAREVYAALERRKKAVEDTGAP